ncbi:hypothetical protein B0T17DRAFT_508683 [Bombardia bombarda]|uniref:Uncharacterized protein n=1 Tax=Bombardia bombarda TaxID=252184 RepID=A0AA40C1B7_9PEZI|nr:hypothetical protein B0T17DRAFT_508683 [Bombardia bombarda]
MHISSLHLQCPLSTITINSDTVEEVGNKEARPKYGAEKYPARGNNVEMKNPTWPSPGVWCGKHNTTASCLQQGLSLPVADSSRQAINAISPHEVMTALLVTIVHKVYVRTETSFHPHTHPLTMKQTGSTGLGRHLSSHLGFAGMAEKGLSPSLCTYGTAGMDEQE